MLKSVSFLKLMAQYAPFINGCVRRFPSRHAEDLRQEGLVGLYNASRTFDENGDVPFDAYAKVCIRNRILTAYRSLRRGDGDEPLDETWPDTADSADERLTRVFFEQLKATLSDREARVLDAYLCDKTHAEICAMTSLTEKQVDNALTRIKQKIKANYLS